MTIVDRPAETASSWVRGRSRWQWPAFGVVLLWALYQTFWRIGAATIQVDEPVYVRAGRQYLQGNFAANREHPPTAKYLMGLGELVHGSTSIVAARLVVATLSFVAGLVTFWWLRRERGFWTGLFAAATWWLLPRYIGAQLPRIDGLALLDPVMLAFAVPGLACAWFWFRRDDWRLAVVSGALLAAAVTSKVDGALLLPALVVLVVANGRSARRTLAGAAAFLVAFGVVFVALYAPMGLRSAITYMLRFQSHHSEVGHLTSVAGRLYRHPPWWSIFAYEQAGVGTLTVVVLLVGMALAFVLRPDRLVLYLAVALAGVVIFFCVVSGVVLPSYYLPMMWFEGVLAALGYSRALAVLRPRAVVGAAVVAAVVLFGVAAARVSVDVTRMHREGLSRLSSFLHDRQRDEHVLFQGVTGSWKFFFPPKHGTTRSTDGPFDAIVIGSDRRVPVDPRLAASLAAHRDRYTRTALGGGIVVWLPLTPP